MNCRYDERVECIMRAAVLGALAALPLAAPALAAEPGWHEAALEQARTVHRETMPADCDADRPGAAEPEVAFPIRIGEGEGARDVLLVQFRCLLGAYNAVAVFVLVDETGTAAPVQFLTPEAAIVYVDADQTQVESIAVGGIVERRTLVNPVYDPERQTLEAYGKWRGLGDAYELTRWALRDGRFELVYYAVDATYDLQDNPQVLIDEQQ
ncbi:MAG: DUF1176 domain-containing protein [Alphaproteobacteria bacterium]